ncbi:MAG: DNA mismatch repair protein MutS [Gammaproteobacteria bacterium]|nr:DNA mismatch repair protein MutS [Gammaproteobacteria bacterium]
MNNDRDDDDLALFRQELDGVRPLQGDRIEPERPRLRPVPGQRIRDNKKVIAALRKADPLHGEHETGEELWYARPGLQQQQQRRLRRGQYPIGKELDLHGKTANEAHAALNRFLTDCRARGIRSVRVIHGKGLRSPGGKPVLKGKLDRWLRQRQDVIAFCFARPVDGGTGAIYVLLSSG